MFFRFAAALFLVVIVSMISIVLEKHTLEMRRSVSRQYYQTDLLLDLQVSLRLQTQQLTAPSQLESRQARIVGRRDDDSPASSPSETPLRIDRPGKGAELPLLRFQHPFRPQGID